MGEHYRDTLWAFGQWFLGMIFSLVVGVIGTSESGIWLLGMLNHAGVELF